ncbi:hypothetical protein PisoF_01091 [Pseudomonas sp. IsoF]|nr:hypothetical protein PisoF_01091 [Pseudomonas sp. IsoF]
MSELINSDPSSKTVRAVILNKQTYPSLLYKAKQERMILKEKCQRVMVMSRLVRLQTQPTVNT